MSPLTGRLEQWDRGTATGVNVEHAPRHTPGSSIVLISSSSARALLLGDVVHCPMELTDPEWALMQDVDAVAAGKTRPELSARIEDGATMVTAGHFPGLSFGRVLRNEYGRRWQPGHPGAVP